MELGAESIQVLVQPSKQFSSKLHWTLATLVLLVDIVLVVSTIYMDQAHHLEPPSPGETDKSAVIGWLGVFGAIFIFGCYGVLVKTPSVQECECDCMVFQCYFSAAVAVVSFVIWFFAGGELSITGSSFAMGLLFGVLWIISQVCGYRAICAIGYAVGPAVWVGVTIVVSFLWGVVAFENPIHSWPLAITALMLLLLGVGLAAASSQISDRLAARKVCLLDQNNVTIAKVGESSKSSAMLSGIFFACIFGVCNGSLMVCMNCFSGGCPSIGVAAYEGEALASLAFLPSLALGVLVAQPPLFLVYWGRAMLRGDMPQFHFSKVALPGLLTGCFWCMGNFNAMFATLYLGQAIGFPLTQCSLVINGLWGILYYKEIRGSSAVLAFCASALVILAGATLDGLS